MKHVTIRNCLECYYRYLAYGAHEWYCTKAGRVIEIRRTSPPGWCPLEDCPKEQSDDGNDEPCQSCGHPMSSIVCDLERGATVGTCFCADCARETEEARP
uniref:Uncharacterized protein n=1 Tax=viral metagenome TaxID=1070528 RepID=A0A6M3J407_9ZZZZ